MVQLTLLAIWSWLGRKISREVGPVSCPIMEEKSEVNLGVSPVGQNNYTGLLYSQPTFLSGFARVLDLGGKFDRYNTSPTENEADALAMASDWYAVVSDLNQAVETFDPGNEASDTRTAHAH